MKIITPLYEKLFPHSKRDAVITILKASKEQNFLRIGFAYFAQLEMMGWYKNPTLLEESEIPKEKHIILDQDFLL